MASCLKFDVIIIGSSPIGMLEAVYWAATNKKVAIIEKGQLGGSWKCVPALGFPILEVGPHVFFGPRLGYKILKKLNLTCKKRAIWNFDIHNKKLYKNFYNFRMFFYERLNGLKKIIPENKRSPKKFFLRKILLNAIKQKISYLDEGCNALLLAIRKLKDWEKVEVIFEECQNILFDKNQKLNVLTRKGCFEADNVIITSCCNLDLNNALLTYAYNANDKVFEKQDFGSAQVTLLLKNNLIDLSFTKFQYAAEDTLGTSNFAKKKKFKYIIDLTKCVENVNKINLEKNDSKIISLAVSPEYYKLLSNSPDLNCLIEDLKEFNLISKDAFLIDSHIEINQGKSLTKKGVDAVNQSFHGRITCIESESLISALSDNYKRWASTINFD